MKATALILLASYLVMLLFLGYVLPFSRRRRTSRLVGWMIAIATFAFSALISSEQPLERMVTILILLLVSMKILVAIETYSKENRLTPLRWAAFCLGWLGMRPVIFENFPATPLPSRRILWKGISRMAIGAVLLYLSLVLEDFGLGIVFIPQLLLLIGLSLIIHFGILNLSTAGWRMLGAKVSELFQSPYKSKSLKEFWGKRWNIAFSEMTAVIAYRPLKTVIGAENALVVSFLFSGLLHEIAISVPVMAGFGLPMTYFAIHALAMRLETHSKVVEKIIRHRWLSRVWVMSLLVLPMPLLFHREFIDRVLIPLRTFLLGSVGIDY